LCRSCNTLHSAHTALLFIQFCIYCFSLWYEFFLKYALRVEKNNQHDLSAGPLEFQFLRPRGYLTTPFTTLSLCFGVIGKHQVLSPVIILLKILSAWNIAIMSWQEVILSSLCSGLKECGTKRTPFSPKFSYRILRTTFLGMFKASAIILDAIRPSFLTKSTAAILTSVRVDFGRSPLVIL
jgi:hypothetical protein